MAPEVSVVIPTYNRAHLLCRAIDSVLEQTFSNFELIIVDDASSDNTKEVVSSYKDKRIVYVRNNVNKGAAGARNAGIAVAKGTYVAFQDSDDVWLPEKLERQIDKITSLGGDVVFSKVQFCDEDNKILPPTHSTALSEGIYRNLLFYGNFIDTPTLVCRKSLFSVIGAFDESLNYIEDWDFALRAAKSGASFVYVPEVLVKSYHTAGGVNDSKCATTLLKVIDRNEVGYRQCPREVLGNKLWECGVLFLKENDLSAARAVMRRSLSHHMNMKRLLGFGASLLGPKIYFFMSTAISGR